MCASAREDARRDFARAKPGSGGLRLPKGLEKEEEKRKNPPPVPGPWALHGPAALALGALAGMPVGGGCVGRQAAGEGPCGFLLLFLAAALTLEGRTLSSGEQPSPGASATPRPLYGFSSRLATACPGTLFFVAKEGFAILPRSGTQATRGPRLGMEHALPAWLSGCQARFS